MVRNKPEGSDGSEDEQGMHSMADTESLRDTEDLTEMLSVAAHELRTPATVILGLSATLLANRQQMSEEQVSEAIVRLDRQSRRMVGLLQDLLDVSRIQNRRLEVALRPVEIAAAVSAALAVAPPPSAKRMETDVPAGLSAIADPAGIERVL